MVVVHREHGFRFVIYVDDHDPAHVHVIGDGEAKIALGRSGTEPQLIFARGMATADLRRVMRTMISRNDTMLLEWRRIHG